MTTVAGAGRGGASRQGARSSDEARDSVTARRGTDGGSEATASSGTGTTSERLGGGTTTAETLGGGLAEPTVDAPEVPDGPPGQGETPVPALVGDGAAGAQGAADVARGIVERRGTRAAADILTRGGGANLPAPGFANRGVLAGELTRPGVTAAQARAATPFSPGATSTQALDDAVRTGGRIGSLGRVVGYGLQPAIGAVVEYRDLPENATLGQRAAALVGGGIAEADDVVVSGASGFAAGGLTALTGAGAVAAPYTGAAAGIAAGRAYDGTGLDSFLDEAVEDHVEPFVESAVDDYAVPAANRAGEFVRNAWEGVRGLFR